MTRLHTTFTLARRHGACQEGYDAMAQALGGVEVYGEDTPIPLSWVATKGRGLYDALWCLRAVLPFEETERDKLARLLACAYAERVLPFYEAKFPGDERPRNCLEVSRRYAYGLATDKELAAAQVAAWAVTGEVAWAARAAARALAWEAAWAAQEAVRETAWAVEVAWQLNHFLKVMEMPNELP